jgi:capsular polysaccharide biosynthesis protein
MNKPWEIIEFIPYVCQHWRIPVIACVSALTLTLAISLQLPKRYTAKVVVSIEPPAGSDARMVAAISPVYLESLKGYERVASSDSLFARAVENFHLKEANPSEPIEAMKRRILKISKIRETRLLEISATLGDPHMAHQFAQYIAQETVAMNRQESAAADRDRASQVEHELAESRLRLDKASKASLGSARSAIEALQSRNDADQDLLAKLRLELAENPGDSAREVAVKAAVVELEREISTNEAKIDAASARREREEAEFNIAQSEYASLSNRLLDLQAAAGTGGERLRIVDPGIVPERPTFPNVLLDVLLATVIAAAGSITYIALSFSYQRRRAHDALFR